MCYRIEGRRKIGSAGFASPSRNTVLRVLTNSPPPFPTLRKSIFQMSSARRREPSADDDPSVAEGANLMKRVALHPTLMAKNSVRVNTGKPVSGRESGNAVESEGSAGPPSLTSTSSDDDEECTYRKNFVEEETAKEQRTNCRRPKILVGLLVGLICAPVLVEPCLGIRRRRL